MGRSKKVHACTRTGWERAHWSSWKQFGAPELTQMDLATSYTHARTCPEGQATSCSTCSTKTEQTL